MDNIKIFINIRKIIILILSIVGILLISIYVNKNEGSVECKSILIYKNEINIGSNIDALRFNISRLIIEEFEPGGGLLKNSLLFNFNENSINAISQIRVLNSKSVFNAKAVEGRLTTNINRIQKLTGYVLVSSSIACADQPRWHQIISPILILILISFFVSRVLFRAKSI